MGLFSPNYSQDELAAAKTALRNGKATATQREYVEKCAKQAGSFGDSARQALREEGKNKK